MVACTGARTVKVGHSRIWILTKPGQECETAAGSTGPGARPGGAAGTPILGDERMREALDLVASKADGQGRWTLEQTFNDKLLVPIETKLPTSIYKVLVAAVAAMARGNAISIVPVYHELTTQQAADLLNVSGAERADRHDRDPIWTDESIARADDHPKHQGRSDDTRVHPAGQRAQCGRAGVDLA